MRTALVVFALFAVASAFDVSKFAALIQTGTRAFDAVESVYNLLRDLKTENLETQVAADAKNQTDEAIGAKTISDLTLISNINQNNWKAAKAHVEDVEKQILDIETWQTWAENRLEEIERRAEQLSEDRCYANALFVKSLKDHSDAVEVVRHLKQDLSGYLTGQPSLAQVNTQNIADKLQMYSHVFQQDAIAKFAQLTAHLAQDKTNGDNITQQIYNILVDLEAQLTQTLSFLQEQEIVAAFALAKWISDTGAEKADIISNQERKEDQHEKLLTAHPAGLALQAKAKKLWSDAQNAVAGAIADLQEKRDYYASETERRAEENAIIDECVQIFKDQVRALASGTSLGRL